MGLIPGRKELDEHVGMFLEGLIEITFAKLEHIAIGLIRESAERTGECEYYLLHNDTINYTFLDMMQTISP